MLFGVNKTSVDAVSSDGGVGVAAYRPELPQPYPLNIDSVLFRLALANARRIVIKIGTALVVDGATGQIRHSWLTGLAQDVGCCIARGQEVLIVSSGAVAVGRHNLSLSNPVLRSAQKQAAASAGQVILTQAFYSAFERQGLRIAQVLLTLDDTEARCRHLSTRLMLDQLLALRTVPLINENDAIAGEGCRIGDNDRLSARVAQMLRADFLVLFSDVDGFYTADPRTNANAKHFREVQEITPEIRSMAGTAGTRFSSGGMITKIIAAELAINAGCHTIIANGKGFRPLTQLSQGARATWFKAHLQRRTGRKAWIAGALKTAGAVVVDGGACDALRHGKSLLPAGILTVEGAFDCGEIIAIRDRGGVEVARGITAYCSREARLLAGHRSHVFERLLGFKGPAEIIQCDDLVLTGSGFANRHQASATRRPSGM